MKTSVFKAVQSCGVASAASILTWPRASHVDMMLVATITRTAFVKIVSNNEAFCLMHHTRQAVLVPVFWQHPNEEPLCELLL